MYNKINNRKEEYGACLDEIREKPIVKGNLNISKDSE
jgi:hypothetical protein